MKHSWRRYDLVFFDCDSTLSSIEGVDELARMKGRFDQVRQLTSAAMGGEVHLSSVYDRRLELLQPTRSDLGRVRDLYGTNLVPDASDLVKALLQLERKVFIVSGGLAPAVLPFGQSLGVPTQHIRAVDLEFDQLAGRWWDYPAGQVGVNPDERYLDFEEGPLTDTKGKADIVRDLRGDAAGRSILVGDGVSDLMAKTEVDLLVGFGGVVRRERVAQEADVYIESESLAPLLPLVLSGDDLPQCHQAGIMPLVDKGMQLIRQGKVHFRDPKMADRFYSSFPVRDMS